MLETTTSVVAFRGASILTVQGVSRMYSLKPETLRLQVYDPLLFLSSYWRGKLDTKMRVKTSTLCKQTGRDLGRIF